MGRNGVLIEPDPRNLKPLIGSRSVSILLFCATDGDDIEITLNLAKDTLYSRIGPHELQGKSYGAEDVAHVLSIKY